MTSSVMDTRTGRGILVSAYAASPAHGSWDPALEAELLPALCDLPGVVGLEIPWLGALHPHNDAWLLQHVPVAAQLSVTALPYVMQRCAADPRYGIASPDAEGRAAAIADLRRLEADVRTLAQQSNAEVSLIGLHTAPRGSADTAALVESLRELADFDWSGAQLVIEHCDAAVPSHPFEKGFLTVGEEIAAIDEADVPVGMWLNWGRSAIELRDADAVAVQIMDVAGSGTLMGLTFSGAGATDGPYGAAWVDGHLPVLETDPSSGSLLDDIHLRSALAAAGDVPWLGVKVSRRPADRTAADVVRSVARNVDLVRVAGEQVVRCRAWNER